MRRGIYRGWISANLVGLGAVERRLTPEARQIISRLGQTGGQTIGGLARLRAYRALGIARQGRAGSMALYLSVLFGWA